MFSSSNVSNDFLSKRYILEFCLCAYSNIIGNSALGPTTTGIFGLIIPAFSKAIFYRVEPKIF
jgi:hypothetical protein